MRRPGRRGRVLLTNHVLSGALIGARARGPEQAFAAGVASHFVLDAIPHWGKWGSRRRFLRVAVADGLVSLAVAGTLVAAALPDVDKPTRLWFGWSPFPRKFDRFHKRIQREAWRRGYVEVLAAGALAPAALIALRGSRVPA